MVGRTGYIANLGVKDKLAGHLASGLQPNGVPMQLKGMTIPFLYNDEKSFLSLWKFMVIKYLQ